MLLSFLLATALASGQEPAAPPLLQRFHVDPAASEVGFHGDSTLHAFTGRTRAISGEVRAVLGDPGALTSGWLRVDARTLDTDNGTRDEKMREHLDVERFPWIDFHVRSAEGSLRDGAGKVDVVGSFVIHGVERERKLTLELSPLGGGLRARGSCTFPMSEHGIEPPSVVLVTVDDPIEVFVDLALTPVQDEVVAVAQHVVAVVERVEPVGGEPQESRHDERLLVLDGGLAWVRPSAGAWLTAGAGGARAYDLVGDAALAAPAPAEDAFALERGRYDRMLLKAGSGARRGRTGEVLARLEAGLALAPAAGEARVEQDGDVVRIVLGDTTWVEARGRAGDGDLGVLLGTFEGVPSAVRAVLGQLDGIPAELVLRTAFPTGARTITARFGAPQTADVPRWALAPEAWIGVSQDARGGAR